MCTSYNGLLSISNDRTNRVIDRYDNDGVVCPSELRDGIFTTVAVHHIDHNQSSTSSHDALHGTTISLVQHPTTEKPGTDRATDVFDPGKSSMSKKIASLLVSCYTDVPPLTLPSTNIVVSNTSTRLVSIWDRDATSNDSDREEDCLQNIRQVLKERELTKEDIVSWVSYQASKSSLSCHRRALISLLPIFTENAHSLAMIAHAINVIISVVKHLNSSQVPVFAVGQPLFVLVKQIQWTDGIAYDESHAVVMLGGLHIVRWLSLKLLASGFLEADGQRH